jgi:hypothetical protein
MGKTILLASFIFPERLEWFTAYLNDKFKIPKDKIFGYRNLDDEAKLIVTFKLNIPDDKFLDIKNLSPNAIIIHKRGNALYTINALNKLIEEISTNNLGNIDHKTFKVNWEEYQNKLILIDNGDLAIWNINRVF